MITNKKRGGFTLMEVLIYTAILGATGTILSGVLLNTTKIKSRQSAVIEVNEQLNFVLQNIQRSISDSSFIDIDNGVSTSTLILRFKDEAKNPTRFYISENRIYKKEAANAAQPLTDDSVVATAVNFLKVSGYSGHDSLQIDLTLSYNTNNVGSAFSRTLSSAIARVSAATFDSDLIPGSAIHDIGTSGNKWQDLYVSGITSFGGVDYTWPAADGTSGQSLSTDGLGVLSWATPSTSWSTLGSNIYNSNAGNVGVGTTTPSDMLTIGGSSGTIGLSIRGDNAACTVYPCIRTGGGGSLQIDSSTASGAFGKLYLNNTKNSDVLIAVGGGNVGIGTTAPLAKLDVRGNAGVGGYAGIIANTTNTDTYHGLLVSNVYNTATNFVLRVKTNTADPLSGGTDIFSIKGDGGVGIGTTVPATVLDVNTTSSAYGVVFRAGTGSGVEIANLSSTLNRIQSYNRTATTFQDLLFRTTVSADTLYLNTSGNVGIGTTNPNAKLEINGNVMVNTGGSANKAICWKADGKTLGYCSTVIGADGSCTCN